MEWYFVVLILFAILVLPNLVGGALARKLKMPDYGWKIGLILCVLVGCLTIDYFGGWMPKLGIDLSGGVNLVYDYTVPREEENEDEGAADFRTEELVAALKKRVDPSNIKEVSITPYGQGQIEIIIPSASSEEVERIRRIITDAGTLEFRIVANHQDHESIIQQALAPANRGALQIELDGRPIARWVPVEKSVQEDYENSNYVTRRNELDELEILLVLDSENVTGDYLRTVQPSFDEFGKPSVKFRFNALGGRLFERLTSKNRPDPITNQKRQLAVVLNGMLYSSPNIIETISEEGIIHGQFSQDEVDDLVSVLRAGSLPAKLDSVPALELEQDPLLGDDLIKKGLTAIGLSMIAVLVFILLYYRFAGMVACFALLMNLVLVLAALISFKAHLTLAGMAGLVLTVGMAVDANVLIFERIREELARGAALRMAIRNGFDRATRTIVDANITTLITATVLFVIGTDQVKGFAVTLWLGIVMSLFTAIFCSRVIFDIAERQRWIKELKMSHIVGATNIDFLGKRKIAAGVSIVVILIGLVGVVGRGLGLLDIDFTGGYRVMVLFEEDQPLPIDEVRKAVELRGDVLKDVSVAGVTLEGEPADIRYNINTSNQDGEAVEKELQELFGKRLARNTMTFTEVAAIPETGSKPEGEKPATPDSGTTPTQGGGSEAEGPDLQDPAAQTPDTENTDPENTSPAGADAAPEEPAATTGTAAEQPASETPATETSAAERPAAENPSTEKPEPKTVRLGASRFAGGTSAIMEFSNVVDHDDLYDRIGTVLEADPDIRSKVYQVYNLESAGGPKPQGKSSRWELRIAADSAHAQRLLEEVQSQWAQATIFPSAARFGGKVAGSTQNAAIAAILASLIAIVAYIWIRFQRVSYGLAAVAALVHDVLVTLGALALSYYLADALGFLLIDPFKIDLSIVAAFLTIVGYSLNDTIVVFDRIREVKGRSPHLTVDIINSSLNQTLARTLLTSITTLIVVGILYIGGGQAIHGFAFALLVGVIVGTYSSLFVASPVLNWLDGDKSPATKDVPQSAKGGAEVASV
jgi:SecD/SecF fusion protein